MPLQKLAFRPGLYREGTAYSSEGGWHDGDKVRFRSGLPEKIGGWTQVSPTQFNGIARSLWTWVDLSSNVYIGVGTNSKYYIYSGGFYNDITPLLTNSNGSTTTTLTASSISTTASSTAVTITDTVSGIQPNVGDFVIISSTAPVGGLTISGEYSVTKVISVTQYQITSSVAASSTASGGGTITVQYEYPTGNITYAASNGWGSGGFSPTIPVSLSNNPFLATAGSTTVTVTQANHGYLYTAGNFTVGQQYTIVSIGSTDFTAIGASANTIGTIFTATGIGSGSGTASISWVAFLGAADVVSVQPSYNFSSGSFNLSDSNGIKFYGHDSKPAVPATLLNSTFLLTYVDANTYTIELAAPATYGGIGGGSSVVAYPEYGIRPWGSAASSGGVYSQLRLWTNDNFGQDLVLAPRGGPIYYWQDSTGVGTRAVALSSLANSTASTITSLSFASGSSTAIASAPAGIYPYSYVTGVGIASGTYVSSSYVIGSTSVPLSIPSTAASSGNYNISYAGQYVPVSTLQVITSAIQEFVIAFGSNSYNGGTYSATFNPMLVRWSDQANAYQWIPQVTNQSGEFALSNGSYIMGARATRQEILIWTNTALYTMQYVGYPYVWSFQLLMDNISVMSPNCMVTVNNITYWMGTSKFYKYDGTVHTLPSALRQYVFDDLNINQAFQVFAGANEGYNEIWWFYVSNESINNSIDKYVIYNYLDNAWSYGTFETVQVAAGSFVTGKQYVISNAGTTNFMAIGAPNNNVGTYFIATGAGTGTGTAWAMNGRSAWIQNNIESNPVAADYNSRLLFHESGVDDNATSQTQPIYAYVQSSDFGIMASDQNNSGQHFGFVWRLLPDVNFNGSNVANPQVTMALYPRLNSGSAYGSTDLNKVVSSQVYAPVTPNEYTIQQFTGEVYTRLRGRQMAFKCYSDTIGTAWQLGTTRYDVKQDGRR